MRGITNERKILRPKSSATLSEKEARKELAKAESLYVLGVNSAYVEQTRRAFEAKYGRSPELFLGKPACGPALCAKVSFPCGLARITDFRVRFFTI